MLFYFLSRQAKSSREMARAISKLKNVSTLLQSQASSQGTLFK